MLAELKWEPSVNAAHIGKVKDGIVTPAGHVDSFAEKHHPEEAAQRASGVKALTVDSTSPFPAPALLGAASICTLPHRPACRKPII